MSAAVLQDGSPSLVDLLLAEQRTLRAVDEFSTWHDSGGAHGGRFESLIPSALPGAGQQFAFAVDLDACTGCKACVTACHSLNGLEVGETWRKVGEVEGAGAACGTAHRQTVTTACHHCAEPACLAGCPVRAYEKDPITGIVIHLDDQCIGCRYCQLMCPYDVPHFSERLGIVRKCDMCHARLAAGEAPACVQGCPNEAISIEIVDCAVDFEVDVDVDVAVEGEYQPRRIASMADPGRASRTPSSGSKSGAMLLPVVQGGMPRSALTGPTTRYRTTREPVADLRAVEGVSPMPSEPHAPLAAMLVLTQASIGTLLFDVLIAAIAPASQGREVRLVALVAAALLGFAGLGVSLLHLGRPQWAFRAVLGLRTSWMSREIVVFGGFAAALAAALFTSTVELWAPARASGLAGWLAGFDPVARWSALATGLAGLVCSVQIYAVTGRPLWRVDRTALRFGATVILLGSAVAAFCASIGAMFGGGSRPATLALALLVVLFGMVAAKLAGERGRLVHGVAGHDEAALARTRLLLADSLAASAGLRRRLGLSCGLGLPVVILVLGLMLDDPLMQSGAVLLCVLGCLAGEIAERELFFRGEAMRGMPGSA